MKLLFPTDRGLSRGAVRFPQRRHLASGLLGIVAALLSIGLGFHRGCGFSPTSITTVSSGNLNPNLVIRWNGTSPDSNPGKAPQISGNLGLGPRSIFNSSFSDPTLRSMYICEVSFSCGLDPWKMGGLKITNSTPARINAFGIFECCSSVIVGDHPNALSWLEICSARFAASPLLAAGWMMAWSPGIASNRFLSNLRRSASSAVSLQFTVRQIRRVANSWSVYLRNSVAKYLASPASFWTSPASVRTAEISCSAPCASVFALRAVVRAVAAEVLAWSASTSTALALALASPAALAASIADCFAVPTSPTSSAVSWSSTINALLSKRSSPAIPRVTIIGPREWSRSFLNVHLSKAVERANTHLNTNSVTRQIISQYSITAPTVRMRVDIAAAHWRNLKLSHEPSMAFWIRAFDEKEHEDARFAASISVYVILCGLLGVPIVAFVVANRKSTRTAPVAPRPTLLFPTHLST